MLTFLREGTMYEILTACFVYRSIFAVQALRKRRVHVHCAAYHFRICIHQGKRKISFVVLFPDAAKSENAPEDMTVYTSLGSTANLSVKFRINPAINCSIIWSMGDSVIHGTDVTHTVKEDHVQATHIITVVRNKNLGNYTVRVINMAMHEHNEVTFAIRLKLRGKRCYAVFTLQFFNRSYILLGNYKV